MIVPRELELLVQHNVLLGNVIVLFTIQRIQTFMKPLTSVR
jgi:hypothetical protein